LVASFFSNEFHSWLSSQSCYTLCFDGASKGNPGEAGVGGVLYGPRGIRELDFYWNLGVTMNNKAEAYAVFQGIQLAKQRQISQLNIVGDSKNTIRYFVTGSTPKDVGLKALIERIWISLSNLSVQFFHILRENNKEVDEMANRAIGLAPGSLGVCGVVRFVTPP
jgi:ribonuclease HI